MGTHVIIEAAIVIKKRAEPMISPDKPDARRLQGARRAVKSPKTSKTNAMR
jgi:hypothetical protein